MAWRQRVESFPSNPGRRGKGAIHILRDNRRLKLISVVKDLNLLMYGGAKSFKCHKELTRKIDIYSSL